MFFVNLVALVAIAVTLMAAVKDGRILREAGVAGSCVHIPMPAGHPEPWHACKDGWVTGRPNMARYGCTRAAERADHDVWLCPEDVVAGEQRETRKS